MHRYCLGLMFFLLFGFQAAFAVTSPAVSDHDLLSSPATCRVKKGDSLYRIARLAKLSVDELMRLNGLTSAKLKLGQVLLLGPAVPAAGATAATEKAPSPVQDQPKSEKVSSVSYKVQKGDSLYVIARKAKLSVDELMRLNGLTSAKLKLGQVLLLGPAAPAVADNAKKKTSAVLAQLQAEDSSLSPLLGKSVQDLLGAPYRFGGSSAKGIDCSGFVQQVFKELHFNLPRSAREQYRLGDEVATGDLQTGDLLFFRTYAKYPSHVGIYLGNNKMLHASVRSRRVVVSNIGSAYFRSRYIGARRLAFNHEGAPLDGLLSVVVEEDSEDGSMEGAEAGVGSEGPAAGG